MNKIIFASRESLLTHGPNQSFGNHLLHLFFVFNVAYKNNLKLAIPCQSNLDELFDLSNFKKEYPNDITKLFEEDYGGIPEEFIQKEKNNFKHLSAILKNEIEFPDNFYLNGWFWHYDLMPSENIFKKIKIKEIHSKYVEEKYKNWIDSNTAVIHYRGTDFANHSIGWGDLRLPFSYYHDGMNHLISQKNIQRILIVSDEPRELRESISNSFPDIEINISDENYLIDWLILKECKNLICSNSSFCWTAGLFNKSITIQAKGFFLKKMNINELVFPPNIYYKKNNIII